jgi:UDP:flavonoid glycosyltransferase YjiC (YdhE family)
MGKILIAVAPLAGHAGPMLIVAGFLRQQGHDVLFSSPDLFREGAGARDQAVFLQERESIKR